MNTVEMSTNSAETPTSIDVNHPTVAKLIAIFEKRTLRINSGEYPQDQVRNITSTAEDHDYKLLGSGYFALAFSHPDLPNIAIKVGLKKEDSGAAYAAWCRDNQELEGVPVIHDIARRKNAYYVVMKEYQNLRPIEQLYEAKKRYYELAGKSIPSAPSTLKDYWGASAVLQGLNNSKAVNAANVEVMDTAKAIYKFFLGVASFDLHGENVMIDPDTNSLVITDPVSFIATSTDQDPKGSGPTDFDPTWVPKKMRGFFGAFNGTFGPSAQKATRECSNWGNSAFNKAAVPINPQCIHGGDLKFLNLNHMPTVPWPQINPKGAAIGPEILTERKRMMDAVLDAILDEINLDMAKRGVSLGIDPGGVDEGIAMRIAGLQHVREVNLGNVGKHIVPHDAPHNMKKPAFLYNRDKKQVFKKK